MSRFTLSHRQQQNDDKTRVIHRIVSEGEITAKVVSPKGGSDQRMALTLRHGVDRCVIAISDQNFQILSAVSDETTDDRIAQSAVNGHKFYEPGVTKTCLRVMKLQPHNRHLALTHRLDPRIPFDAIKSELIRFLKPTYIHSDHDIAMAEIISLLSGVNLFVSKALNLDRACNILITGDGIAKFPTCLTIKHIKMWHNPRGSAPHIQSENLLYGSRLPIDLDGFTSSDISAHDLLEAYDETKALIDDFYAFARQDEMIRAEEASARAEIGIH